MSCISWLPFDFSATQDFTGRTWTATGNPTVASSLQKSAAALQLDGSSYITSTGDFSIGRQDFTIDGWAYLDSSGMTLRRFIFEFYNEAKNNIFALYSNKTGTQLSLLLKINGDNAVWQSTASPIKNSLFHFALAYTHSTNKLTLYINGKTVYSVTVTALNNIVPFPEANIGYARSHDAYWKGSIDEFRFYNGEVFYSAPFSVPGVETGFSDTYRAVKKLWRYENAGYAEKTLRRGHDITPTAAQSRTGAAFWYFTNDMAYFGDRMFPTPKNMNELWARVDMYITGERWYLCSCYSRKRNGLASEWGSLTFYANGNAVHTMSAITGLHQFLLHIIAGERIEYWLDGNLVHSYTGSDVNGGTPITNFCMSTIDGNYGTLFSNVVLSEESLLSDDTIIRANEWQFIQPILSSNGTMGVDDFAVETTSTDTAAYRMFNGSESYYASGMNEGVTITFYTKAAIRVRKVYIFGTDNRTPSSGTIAHSDDGMNFTDCGGWDDTKEGLAGYWVAATSDESGYYNYHRLTITKRCSKAPQSNSCICNINIDATIEIPGDYGYSDTFRTVIGNQAGCSDTLRKVIPDRIQTGYTDTLRIVGNVADTLRIVESNQTGFSDTLRKSLLSLSLDFDTELEKEAIINQSFDTEIKVPHMAIVSPVPSPIPAPVPQENTGTIRSISVTLNEQQVTDDLTIEAVSDYDIMELIQGSYLDYAFSMRVESMTRSGGITIARLSWKGSNASVLRSLMRPRR